MQVGIERSRDEDGRIRLTARFGREAFSFRVPEAHAGGLTRSADPFVVALVHRFMRIGEPAHVCAAVSPTLLRNLEEFMAAFSAWRPGFYRPVEITADREEEPPPPESREALAAFSGGVDSCNTVWRHTRSRFGRRKQPLSAALFLQGLDTPVEPRERTERARARLAELVTSVGLELLTVETSFRELDIDWYEASGAAVVAGLLLFQGRFSSGLIAASAGYQNLVVPAPSSPLTDHLLSTGVMRTIHDGAELLRPQRAREIAAWPEARRLLRVCWEGPGLPENCCVCEKCVRTILNFRVTGCGLPECFSRDVSNQQLRRLRVEHPGALCGFQNILAVARERGIEEPWVTEVRRILRRAARRRRRHAIKRAFWRLRQVGRTDEVA